MNIKQVCIDNQNSNAWNTRFMWSTSKKTLVHSSSISDFFKTLDVVSTFSGVGDTMDYYNRVIKLVEPYLDFIVRNAESSGEYSYSDKELEDARNFFIGAMGEYFFIEIVMNKGKIEFRTKVDNRTVNKIFYNATLAPNPDFGIDGVCQDEYGKNCVVQVKFWNPWDKNIKLTHDVAQAFVGRGLLEKITDVDSDKNSILCWIGDDSKVSSWIKKDKLLDNKLLFIDRHVLKNSIPNGQDSMFWKDTFMSCMNSISSIRTI